jgi:hypothetical protein
MKSSILSILSILSNYSLAVPIFDKSCSVYEKQKTDVFKNDNIGESIVIDSMEITPGIVGDYKVDFNATYNTELSDVTHQSLIDLNELYSSLLSKETTGTFPEITAGSSLSPGVYSQTAAVSFTGKLTFDGKNDTDSIFIVRSVGAINVAAAVDFKLINEAKPENIFFVSGGAIGIGAGSKVSGIFLCVGAISAGDGVSITGKLLSTSGALSIGGSIENTESSNYEMGFLSKFVMFTASGAISNLGPNIIVGNIGTNIGAITGFDILTFKGDIYIPGDLLSLTKFSIYLDDKLVSSSGIESEDIKTEDIVMTDIVSIKKTQTIRIKVISSGISRFYNRFLTLTRVCDDEDSCGNGLIGNGVCSDDSMCCSSHGWCGITEDHCAPVNPSCGNGLIGNGVCSDDSMCCSSHGWCGITEDHCAPVNPSCGNGLIGNGVCSDDSMCCSSYGWCGITEDHCAPVNSSCGNGLIGNGVCSDDSMCCSSHGWCGITEDHCAPVNPSCGNGLIGNGVCSDDSMCCSSHGWCGTSDAHCS